MRGPLIPLRFNDVLPRPDCSAQPVLCNQRTGERGVVAAVQGCLSASRVGAPQRQASRCLFGFQKAKRDNVRVDAAARFHSSITGTIKLKNTRPPLASNNLLYAPKLFAFWRRYLRCLSGGKLPAIVCFYPNRCIPNFVDNFDWRTFVFPIGERCELLFSRAVARFDCDVLIYTNITVMGGNIRAWAN
jgi:hypothetical protein